MAFSNPTLSWDKLAFLRESTELPILLKGILHPDDARLAVEHGIDGVIVSNHGGRQVDGAIATLDALPAVADAVRRRVRRCCSTAASARAPTSSRRSRWAPTPCCSGRPYVWGLALGGEAAVTPWCAACWRSST